MSLTPRLSLRLLAVLTLALSLPVMAQDIPPPPDVPAIPGVPSLDSAPLQFAGVLVQLAQAGRWGAFASLAVFALVYVVRKFGSKLPAGKVRDALLSKWGGWALNFLLAVAAGFAGVTFIGVPITVVVVVGILGAAVSYALGAAGLVELQKDIVGKAEAKGTEAAAAVTDKAAAVSALERGPNP